MRNLLTISMMLFALSVMAQETEYVDLGLPSGTKWQNSNEGGDTVRYTYDEAVGRFGSKLPTDEQFKELKNLCTWTWTGNGYRVTGPNGNSIILPAAGRRSCDGVVEYVGGLGHYWSSSLYDSDTEAVPGSLGFYWDEVEGMGEVGTGFSKRCYGFSVRLVQPSAQPSAYVDLGLPSGTKWKYSNEGGDTVHYTYDEAVGRFGSKLPTDEQFKELKNLCTWTWTDNGYRVTGPNGNSIVLPAAGTRACDGEVYVVGDFGCYWSSTPSSSTAAYGLNFGTVELGIYSDYRCGGYSVRLVQ